MTMVASGAALLQRQNREPELRWLIVQRRMYSRAKRWSYLRLFGYGVLAVGGTLVSVVYPASVAAVGAFAGAWLFLTRTVFLWRERRWSVPAAGAQDCFDRGVFGLPSSSAVTYQPTPEEAADIIGNDDVDDVAEDEELTGWYDLDPRLDGPSAIAIAQRANAAYSARLLQRHANVWLAGALLWALVALSLSLVASLTVAEFLMGILLPVLPAVLDAKDVWSEASREATARHKLAAILEAEVVAASPQQSDLRLWQDQLYRLRSTGPLVPDALYRRTRKKNEAAMKAAAAELSRKALQRQGTCE